MVCGWRDVVWCHSYLVWILVGIHVPTILRNSGENTGYFTIISQ